MELVVMSSSDSSNPNLPNKGTSDNCAGPYFTGNGIIEISAALDPLKEIYQYTKDNSSEHKDVVITKVDLGAMPE
jgi:hypothetical protein